MHVISLGALYITFLLLLQLNLWSRKKFSMNPFLDWKTVAFTTRGKQKFVIKSNRMLKDTLSRQSSIIVDLCKDVVAKNSSGLSVKDVFEHFSEVNLQEEENWTNRWHSEMQ